MSRRKQQLTIIKLLGTIVGLLKAKLALSKLLGSKHQLKPLVKRNAQEIVKEMKELGHPVRIVEGYRSMEKQAGYYNQGRTTPGNIITNAKPGQSFHNYGVAVDFVFRKEGYNASKELWETLGTVGKKHGFEWGGDWSGFVDRPHMQYTAGYSLHDFQNGKVDWFLFK